MPGPPGLWREQIDSFQFNVHAAIFVPQGEGETCENDEGIESYTEYWSISSRSDSQPGTVVQLASDLPTPPTADLPNLPNLQNTELPQLPPKDLQNLPKAAQPELTTVSTTRTALQKKKKKKKLIKEQPTSPIRPAHSTYTFSTEAEIATLAAASTWHRQFTGTTPPYRARCSICIRLIESDKTLCSTCMATERQWALDEDIDDQLLAKLRAFRTRNRARECEQASS